MLSFAVVVEKEKKKTSYIVSRRHVSVRYAVDACQLVITHSTCLLMDPWWSLNRLVLIYFSLSPRFNPDTMVRPLFMTYNLRLCYTVLCPEPSGPVSRFRVVLCRRHAGRRANIPTRIDPVLQEKEMT